MAPLERLLNVKRLMRKPQLESQLWSTKSFVMVCCIAEMLFDRAGPLAYTVRLAIDPLLYEGDVNRPLEPTPVAINPIKFPKVLYNRAIQL